MKGLNIIFKLNNKLATGLVLSLSLFLAQNVFAEENAEINAEVNAEAKFETIVGIGVTLEQRDHNFFIAELVQGASAERDGRLLPGDSIVQVRSKTDGQWVATEGLNMVELVGLIRGEEESLVGLRLDTGLAIYEVTLARKPYEVPALCFRPLINSPGE